MIKKWLSLLDSKDGIFMGFNPLTGVKRTTFDHMVGILEEAEAHKKRGGGGPAIQTSLVG